jgi:acetylornithine deacetylase
VRAGCGPAEDQAEPPGTKHRSYRPSPKNPSTRHDTVLSDRGYSLPVDPTIELLRDLVAIDSVNPSLVPGATGEAALAAAVAAELRAIGLDVETREAAPGRPNVAGLLDSGRPGRTLMLCGHTDTVGIEGMTAPFDPVIREGRLYGRGAQDMKGGLAAMIGAAGVLARGRLAAGRLLVAAVVDEEYASLGADLLVEQWTADAAVITEPTDLEIAIAHKGFSWVELEIRGRAAHGSRPGDGRDAILRMGRALGRLEALDGELQRRPPHPLLGTPSLHASIIQGGREMSTYPDRCVLRFERRTVPGEAVSCALEEARAILADLARTDPEYEGLARPLIGRPAYELAASHPLPQTLARVLRQTGRTSRLGGMSFWTDAAVLGAAGIPAALFGPGGAGLHAAEEYVRIDDVLACRDALAALVRAFC